MSNVFAFSGQNTYIPSTESTGNLLVAYSRNPNAFTLPQYVGYRMVDKMEGFFTIINPDESARIINQQDYDWPPGNDAPKYFGQNNQFFTYQLYVTRRKAYPFIADQLAVQQGSWPVLAAHAASVAAKAMTDRTITVLNALNTGGLTSNSVATIVGAGGATWANTQFNSGPGSANYLNIKKSLFGVVQTINQATNATVGWKDLVLIVSPGLAAAMAESDEVHGYMKSTQFAMEVTKGVNFIGQWGLPDFLYGLKVIVEDCVQVTSQVAAARSSSYVLANNVAYVISRKEGLQANTFGPSFNTINCFFHQDEMTVESKYDDENRRFSGRVVQNFAAVVQAPITGYQITACQ